jgi:hypothetical protein
MQMTLDDSQIWYKVKNNKQTFIFLLIDVYRVYSLPGLIQFVHKTA